MRHDIANQMSINTSSFPRLYSVADEPLALFVTPGWQDHLVLSQLLSEGAAGMSGMIFDPCCEKLHGSLKDAARKKGLWCVLDTKMLEISTPGGFTSRRHELPWAPLKPHTIGDFAGQKTDDICRRIAQFVSDYGYTWLSSPRHIILPRELSIRGSQSTSPLLRGSELVWIRWASETFIFFILWLFR